MSGAAWAHRRRAAWAALSGELDERGLLEALQLQQALQRGDSVNDIIGFVDAIGDRHGWPASVRKRLYAAYFDALRLPADALPADPLAAPVPAPVAVNPQVPTSSAAREGLSPTPAPAPATATAQSLPAVSSGVGAPAGTPAEPVPAQPAATPAAAHQVVFASLVMALIQGVRQYHPRELGDLLADARVRIERMRVAPVVRGAARDALVSPRQEAWVFDASARELAALVHELYITTCEALGPVDADQLLMHAVRHAETVPQAREFPPARLL